jgi:hypothetical protein
MEALLATTGRRAAEPLCQTPARSESHEKEATAWWGVLAGMRRGHYYERKKKFLGFVWRRGQLRVGDFGVGGLGL